MEVLREAATSATRALRGAGRASGHHGEILQGVFDAGGQLRRGLLSLPCPELWSEVHVELRAGAPLEVRPAWRVKVRRAVELTLAEVSEPDLGGVVDVTSNITPSRGYGSSTSDVTAAIRAVLDALRRPAAPEHIARLAVAAEGASDNTPFPRPTLFAHRDGVVIEDYGAQLPAMHVVAFETQPGGTGVETLRLKPARYTSWEVSAFGVARALLRRAILRADVRELGVVAVASARINQRYLPVPRFEELTALGRRVGAAGLQVAHSGDIAGLLFDPAADGVERAMARAGEKLEAMRLSPWTFSIEEARWALA